MVLQTRDIDACPEDGFEERPGLLDIIRPGNVTRHIVGVVLDSSDPLVIQ